MEDPKGALIKERDTVIAEQEQQIANLQQKVVQLRGENEQQLSEARKKIENMQDDFELLDSKYNEAIEQKNHLRDSGDRAIEIAREERFRLKKELADAKAANESLTANAHSATVIPETVGPWRKCSDLFGFSHDYNVPFMLDTIIIQCPTCVGHHPHTMSQASWYKC